MASTKENENSPKHEIFIRAPPNSPVVLKNRIYDLENQNNESKLESKCEICIICFSFIFTISLIAAIVAFIVFGIMFLVKDYKIANDCKGSSLWAYGLVTIILFINKGNSKNTLKDKDVQFATLLCVGLIEIGLGIWGGIELFENSCDDLSKTNLWKFCLANFIFQMVFAFLLLIVLPLFLVIIK